MVNVLRARHYLCNSTLTSLARPHVGGAIATLFHELLHGQRLDEIAPFSLPIDMLEKRLVVEAEWPFVLPILVDFGIAVLPKASREAIFLIVPGGVGNLAPLSSGASLLISASAA